MATLDRGTTLVEEFATAWVKANRNASKDSANKDGARHLLSLLAAYARHPGGRTILLPTRKVHPVGTRLRFELLANDVLKRYQHKEQA